MKIPSLAKALFVSILLCPNALAENPPLFDHRAYYFQDQNDRVLIDQITATWARANRTLFCRGLDDIFDAYRLSDHKSWIFQSRSGGAPTPLTRKEISALDFDQPDKSLLVVSLSGAALGKNLKDSEANVKQLEPFVTSLGYKRVLVLRGAHLPESIHVMRDLIVASGEGN